MKKALLIYFFCCSTFNCFSQMKNDLQLDHIKGNVKELIEITYYIGSDTSKTGLGIKRITQYNVHGQKVKEEYYDEVIKSRDTIIYDNFGVKHERKRHDFFLKQDEVYYYSFDTDKNELSEQSFIDGDRTATWIFHYNNNGDLQFIKIINPDGSSRGKIMYEYDINKKWECFSSFDPFNKRLFLYNDNGDEIQFCVLNSDNLTLGALGNITKNVYNKYDSLNNWLVQSKYHDNKLEERVIRNITYWPN